MTHHSYTDRFGSQLEQLLLRRCTEAGALGGTLLATPDIDDLWTSFAPEYLADAVPQLAAYPTVALAWAAYLGMAVAQGWDTDWTATASAPYSSYYGARGFDDMDDHIVRDLLHLPLDSAGATQLADLWRACAETALQLIRSEQIEPQSPMAFHVFVCATRTLFRIGAAVRLHQLGYRFEAIG